MKIKTIVILTISFLIIISAFLIFQNSVLAIDAPSVTFDGGDDVLQNGGEDDPYDSLIIFTINTNDEGFTDYELEYSNDGGDSWDPIAADYEVDGGNARVYYWSTSLIYAPTLLFRARSVHGEEFSPYVYKTLALSHRQTNNTAHYFVEDFNTSDDLGNLNQINWENGSPHLELAEVAHGQYYLSGQATSLDLLRNLGNEIITQVIFQPAQVDASQTIRYQLSNDGSTWYGPGVDEWLTLAAGEVVPAAQEIIFTDSTGDQLFWRAGFITDDNQVTPRIYQLRFSWQENYSPQACFTVEPPNSNDPEELFQFNATCSSDYEDAIGQLYYRWNFDGEEGWEEEGLGTFGYEPEWNFGSTSTQTIVLEVEDNYEATDNFTGEVNTGDIASSIYGWAWSYNYGWTSLNCDNVYYNEEINLCSATGGYGLTMHPNNTIDGWAWDANIGWLCFGSSCAGYGDPPYGDPIVWYDRANGEVGGWAKYLVYGEQSEDGWLLLRDQAWCGVGEFDCTNINMSRHTLEGMAWNGFTDQGVSRGVGWLQFKGNVSVPWLEAKYGLVYGRGDVGSGQTFGAPDERYNATYCIRAGGEIVNFTSESDCEESDYADLGYPALGNRYRTILGLIDFDRILNSYEVEVFDESNDVDEAMSNFRTLGNKVYHFTGFDDYYIGSPLTFYHARNFDSSGAGTVIIDGNLHINKNLYYESNAVTSQIENLASIAWLVKGDVYIDYAVSNIVGNFIVTGIEPAVECNQECSEEQAGNGCGEFYTGSDLASQRQLVVSGLAMSRRFCLERFFKAGGEPAEKIIYDGRVMINTPPGLEDVAKGLPVWREAMASTEIE